MIIANKQASSKLNRRASIYHMAKKTEVVDGVAVYVKDALGQYPVVRTLKANVWCGVTPQTGSMLSGRVADTILTRTTHKVTIRYRNDISEDDWLEINGTRYDILYILNPYLANETLEIFCEVKKYGR